MLETTSDAPPPARAERASRNRGSERAKATPNSTTPAETPTTRQPRNGQPSNAAEANMQPAEAATAVAEIPTAPTIAFAAAVEALATGIACEAAPETKDAETAAATDQNAGTGDMNVSVAAEATVTDVTPSVVAAVVAPTPPPVIAPAATPTIDTTTVAAVDLEAAPAAPVKTAPQAPTDPFDAPAADPAKPQATSDATVEAPVNQTAPRDDAQKATALKAATLDDTPEANSPAPADHKGETPKAKPEPHAAARPPDPQAPRDAAVPAEPKAPAPHHPQAQASEHAAPAARAAPTERPELPANAAAPAQANASAPPPPFNLTAHIPAPLATSPLAALRLDTTADNAIPVAGLAVEIVSRAMDGHRRFDIRLDPPELGRIDVRLDVDHGGKVTSRLMVERVETLDLLRRDAPQLERALQHAGLNTEGGLEFSLRDQNFANREQAPRDSNAARLIVPDDEAVATEAARRGYGRMIGLGGGIDIRV
jgi:chemotaxis protein MotD